MVADHIRVPGVGRYVGPGMRFWLGMHANGARRHIIPVKGSQEVHQCDVVLPGVLGEQRRGPDQPHRP
jgi:hypothetical protein